MLTRWVPGSQFAQIVTLGGGRQMAAAPAPALSPPGQTRGADIGCGAPCSVQGCEHAECAMPVFCLTS